MHRTALQWHQACYFLWGTVLVWGGTSSDSGGQGPECPRGVGPAASLQQFIELNYRIFVQQILLENKEMRTI